MNTEELAERLSANRYVIEVNSEGVHLDNTLLASDTAKLHNIGAAKLAMIENLEALSPEAAQSFKDWDCGRAGLRRLGRDARGHGTT